MSRKSIILSLIALLISYWVTSIIYELLIVPNLSGIYKVPMIWWIGSIAPVIIVSVSIGILLKRFSSIVVTAILGAILYLAFDYVKAVTLAPGYLKSDLAESGIASAVYYIPLYFILLLCLMLGGWCASNMKGKIWGKGVKGSKKP